jgi:hypothetical protein
MAIRQHMAFQNIAFQDVESLIILSKLRHITAPNEYLLHAHETGLYVFSITCSPLDRAVGQKGGYVKVSVE